MRLFIFCFLSLLAFHISAQNLYIAESEDINLHIDDFSVIGKYRNKIVCYRKRNHNPELIFYSEKMEKEKTLELSFLPNNFSNIQFYTDEKNLIVLYETKESKSLKLFGSSLLDENENLWKEPTLMSRKPVGLFKEQISYNTIASENKQYFFAHTYFFDGGKEQLQAVVFDIHLNISMAISQDIGDKNYYFSGEAAISDKGLPVLITTDRPNNKGQVERVDLLVLKNSEMAPFSVPLERHSVNECKLKVDNVNQVIYVSSFFSQSKYAAPRGVYFTVFDPALQLFSNTHFSSVSLSSGAKNDDLKDLSIRQIFLKSNGGIELVAEKYYQNTRVINSINPMMGTNFMMANDNSRRVTEYNYNEVYLFNFKQDGSLLWSQTILKEQISTEDGGIYSSYYPLQYPLGNAFVFNDLSSQKSRLLVSYVSFKGELNMKQIQTTTEQDNWDLMPRSAIQISKSELVFPCIKKNQLSFIKLTF